MHAERTERSFDWTDPTLTSGWNEGGRGRGVCGEDCNHTDTTRSHVGGHHDWALARLEFVEHPITLVLLLVTVNGECGPTVLAEKSSNVISDTLRAGEDKDLVALVFHNLLEMSKHLVTLLEVRHDFDNLGNAGVGVQVV